MPVSIVATPYAAPATAPVPLATSPALLTTCWNELAASPVLVSAAPQLSRTLQATIPISSLLAQLSLTPSFSRIWNSPCAKAAVDRHAAATASTSGVPAPPVQVATATEATTAAILPMVPQIF